MLNLEWSNMFTGYGIVHCWVGVELPPRLLAPPVEVAAPEAREASCLALNVARQLGKIGSFTMFQWWGSAMERGTVI